MHAMICRSGGELMGVFFYFSNLLHLAEFETLMGGGEES